MLSTVMDGSQKGRRGVRCAANMLFSLFRQLDHYKEPANKPLHSMLTTASNIVLSK